jgi:glutathione synthase/RimK-type ligase-like ATP-grasp enzyme
MEARTPCEGLLASWTDLAKAFVVNRPKDMSSNGSKPFQAGLIQSLGFDVPDTLITTDPAAVWAFLKRHGALIYKSTSDVRSIVSRLTPAHRDRIADILTCPTQFQEYVQGVDFRVHVVGEEVFGCEIESEADDYRYAAMQGLSLSMRASELPAAVEDRCRSVAAGLSLSVAGIDLRRRADGRWCCFEVNPSPGFTFYEHATGQPIAAAIARLLAAK